MKEKLLHLLSRLREQLQALNLKRAGTRWPRVAWNGRLLAKTALALLLCLLLPLGVAAYWFVTHPAEDLRAWSLGRLAQSVGATHIQAGALRWSHSLMRLELGLAFKDLEIEGAGTLRAGHFPEARMAFSLFGLMGSKNSYRFEAERADLEMAFGPGAFKNEAPNKFSTELSTKLFKWLPSGGSWDLSLKQSTLSLDSSKELRDLDAELRVGSFPGPIEGRLSADLAFEDKSWVLVGPVSLIWKGKIEERAGKGKMLRLNRASLDLSASSFEAWGFLQKGPQVPLQIDVQGTLAPEGTQRDAQFLGMNLHEGRLNYDGLMVHFDTQTEAEGILSLSWTIGRTERESLRLPLPALRMVGGKGIIDSNGSLKLSSNLDECHGHWRLGLNNFTWDAEKLALALGQAGSTSSGPLRASLVTEGHIKSGHLSSPRTEIQIQATQAQVDFWGGRFIKPKGDEARLLSRAELAEDGLKVRDFKLDLHTLSAQGEAKVSGLKNWMRSQGPANLEASFHTNALDLSRWAAYFPDFSRVPLQGFLHLAGTVGVDVGAGGGPLRWNVERLSLSNFKGSTEHAPLAEQSKDQFQISGPIGANLLFRGRGEGWQVERGDLMANLDLTEAFFTLGGRFRKPEKIPMTVDLSLEQARNSLKVRRGSLRLHELALKFAGGLVQGSDRNRLAVEMQEPVRLENWKGFFVGLPSGFPLKGQLQWQGDLGFVQNQSREAALDWSKVSLMGEFAFRDLSFPFEIFGKSLVGATGKILLQPTVVTIPDLRFMADGSAVSLAGTLRRRAPKADSFIQLSDWFRPRPVEVEATLSLARLDPHSFLPQEKGLLGKFLSSGFAPESRVRLAVNAVRGEWEGQALSKLLARFEWDQGQLRVRPFSVQAMGGQWSGSLSSDFRPAYQRKDPILHHANLTLKNLEWPKFLEFVGGQEWGFEKTGRLSGSLTASASSNSKDFKLDEMKARFRASLKGASHVADEALANMLKNFFKESPGVDYFLKDARPMACVSEKFDAKFDAQISPAGVQVEQLELRYASGTQVRLAGDFGTEGDFQTTAFLRPGASCVLKDSRACLLSLAPKAGIPFVMSGSAGVPKLRMESKEWSRSLASCVSATIRKRITAAPASTP